MRDGFLSGARQQRMLLIGSAGLIAAVGMIATAPHSKSTSHRGPAIHAPEAQVKRAVSQSAAAPAPSGITADLHTGQRAFSIRVAEDDIVGGFVQSGDYVDIVATIPGAAFQPTTVTADRSHALVLLQDVRVLAVGSNLTQASGAQTDARTVSLALAPEQLVRLTLAQRLGRVSLAVRKPGDDEQRAAPRTTLTDLVPEDAPTPARAPAPHPLAEHQILFYAGAHATSLPAERAP